MSAATAATPQSLAREFSRIIREWLTPEEMAEVIEQNRAFDRVGTMACATHDFCDANMAMLEAFTNLGVAFDADLWNEAWELAKTSEFAIGEKVRYCHECGGPATQTRGGYVRHEGVDEYDSIDLCDECAPAFDRKHEKPERGI